MVRKLARKKYRGVVLVEFALVLTLLLLLTLGAIKYGHLFLKAQLLTNAARAGAREAALAGSDWNSVNGIITGHMNAAGMGGSGYSWTFTPTNAFAPPLSGTAVTIQITVAAANVDVLNVPLFPAIGNIGATVTMAKEGP
jgi:Flp pilus assembly protein TadG